MSKQEQLEKKVVDAYVAYVDAGAAYVQAIDELKEYHTGARQ